MLVFGDFGLLAILYTCFHERYSKVTCWIFLAESSLVSTFTVVAARCFASFLPSPMPGKLSYFFTYPDCLFSWGSLIVLVASAVSGASPSSCCHHQFTLVPTTAHICAGPRPLQACCSKTPR